MRQIFENVYELSPIVENDFLFSEEVEKQYREFLHFCELTNDGQNMILSEGKITDFFKDVASFIKSLASIIGMKMKELFQLFKERMVFSFFQYFKFSISAIVDVLKQGYNIYKKVIGFIPELVAKFSMNSRGFKWTKEKLALLSKWLKDHPILVRLSGVALAGLLLFIWLNMSFTGSFGEDMDFSSIFDSLTGKYDITDFLTSEGGIKTLVLLATGILGMSFTWFTTPVNIMLALITTLAKKFKIRLQKGEDT